jgi:hypothetical protein
MSIENLKAVISERSEACIYQYFARRARRGAGREKKAGEN